MQRQCIVLTFAQVHSHVAHRAISLVRTLSNHPSTGAGRAATGLAGAAVATRVASAAKATRVALTLRVAERAAVAVCMGLVVWSVCLLSGLRGMCQGEGCAKGAKKYPYGCACEMGS